MSDANLPPSLAVVPNIPYEKQTIRELELERAYWKGKLDSAIGWGASIGAAAEFMKACDVWLERKRSEDRP